MKVMLVSLGCDKNRVDSEMMLGQLSQGGYSFTDNEDEAEAVIINTCCFIGDAKQESVDTILEFAARRRNGQLAALVVAGCLASRYASQIQEEIPEVDAVVDALSVDAIVPTLEGVLDGKPRNHLEDCERPIVYGKRRILTTGGHFAYLKIAEGCDKRCSYCVIPQVRGRYRSVPMEALIDEAERLAGEGVRELILVAQETTLYGVDLYGKKMLPVLLERLCAISGLVWIRVLYCYPEEITDELLSVMKREPKICHYLDIPIQHASDAVLRRMGRRTDRAGLEAILTKIRAKIPDICLRTTLISGFPGETRGDFETLLQFVLEWKFDRLGVFAYSREEGTPAAEMPAQVSERKKQKRRKELLLAQQQIAFDQAEALVGRTFPVMIDGRLTQEDVYVARTYRDAPDVDGYLFLQTKRELGSGDFVRARVIGAHDYDLIGVLEDESGK